MIYNQKHLQSKARNLTWRSCGVPLYQLLEWGVEVKEVYSRESRMEEVKVATDNGNILSYMLSNVFELEASNKALVDCSNALEAIIIAQDSKTYTIMGLLQERGTLMRQIKRSQEDISLTEEISDGKQLTATSCELLSSLPSINTILC